MGVKIKDIAQICGVGISTVSRVINNSGPVSEATKKKVLEAIRTHHFVPNNSARSLKITQTNTIGLMVKGIANPFFNKMIGIIEQEITFRGYALMIHNVDSSSDELQMAIQESQDHNLCGVILMGGYFSYSEEKLNRLSIPCVMLTIDAGDGIDRTLYSSVRINDEIEGFRATEYLISLGHRRIGFMYHKPADELTPNAMRFLGYKRALATYDIPFDNDLVAKNYDDGSSGFRVGFTQMKKLLKQNRDMTAIFAFADILAIGAAKAVYSMELTIPDDISIIGFDGIEMAEYFNPSLDTVYQPATEMALSCVAILFEMMVGRDSQHLIFDSVLMKRGSCTSPSGKIRTG